MRDKRQRFVALAEARVNRSIKDIRFVGNLANRSLYGHTIEVTQKISRVLQRQLDATKNRFLPSSKGSSSEFKLESKE